MKIWNQQFLEKFDDLTGAAELGGQGGHLPTQIFEKHQQIELKDLEFYDIK